MGDDQSGRWAQSEQLLKWLNKVSEEALDLAELETAPDVGCARWPRASEVPGVAARAQLLDFSGIQYEALQLLEKAAGSAGASCAKSSRT
jgi:DNA helicase-2/ATP-dependent DNA helicase PcrA